MINIEELAEILRYLYWFEVGEPRGDWLEASPQSRAAWIKVAERALEEVEGPRG